MFPLTLPNVLTVVRIVLVPVLVVALVGDTSADVVAAGVFALASVTDAVDGYLARTRDAVTAFGKLMDPIADKLLIAAALLALVAEDRIALWIALVIIIREAAVTLSRMLARHQGVVIAANAWGKVKTAAQVAAIFFAIAFDPTPAWVEALLYAAVGVTVISGVDYFLGVRRHMDGDGTARRSAREPV